MKINTNDLRTLRFCVVMTHELLAVASDEAEIKNLKQHLCRLRKLSSLLLAAVGQTELDLSHTIKTGIPDNSAQAKGIKSLYEPSSTN